MVSEKVPTSIVAVQPSLSAGPEIDPSNPPLLHDTSLEAPVDNEASDGWTVRLCCHKGSNDCGTCCLSYLFPYIVVGKTQWRLRQLGRGQDPLDSSWSRSKALNFTCLLSLGLSLSSYAGFLVSAYQRNRIRSRYGINGNCCGDIVMAAVCCGRVVAQNDREIRAREGDPKFRGKLKNEGTTQGAEAHSTIKPPPPAQPMRYVSPRQTSDNTTHSASILPSQPPQDPQVKGSKSFPLPSKKPKKHGKGTDKKAKTDGPAVDSLPGKKAAPHTGGPDSQIDGTRCAPIHDANKPIDQQPTPQASQMLLDVPNLEIKGTKNGMNHSTQWPVLPVSHSTKNDSQPADLWKTSHFAAKPTYSSLDDEEIATPEQTTTAPVAHTLGPARTTRNGTKVQELSYVHDFGDSFVSRSVLMYYEKEESKLKKQSLKDSTTTNPYPKGSSLHPLVGSQVDPHGISTDIIVEEPPSSESLSAGDIVTDIVSPTSSHRKETTDGTEGIKLRTVRSVEDYVPIPFPDAVVFPAEKRAGSY